LLTHPLTQKRINNLTASIRSRQLRVPRFKTGDAIKRVQLLIRLKQNTGTVMKDLEKKYRARPEDPEATHLLGIAYGANGDWARARDQLEQAIQLGPTIPGIDRDLGRAYTHTRQFQKAHEAFQREISKERDDPVTHLYLGELFEKESDYRGAVRSYLRARQLVPLWPEVARRLGYAYRKLNRAAEAHYYLGQSYLLQDEEEKAIQSLERAIREHKEGSPRIQVIQDEIEAIREQLNNG
jgi:predicted Zn-dependent protease